jgi:hypothetical protein
MSNKAAILYYTLLFYLFFILIFSDLMVRLHFAKIEFKQYPSLEMFSYIESFVLQETIQSFRREKLKPFIVNTNQGQVHVRFSDEVAWIFYDLDLKRYARLDYDMVFDSTISYVYLDLGEFSFVDKVVD